MIKEEDLLGRLIGYSDLEVEKIKKAYQYASLLHEGQMRQSGEPYITHPLNVACILADMNADSDTICAGLLHDTLEDTNIKYDDIANDFNDDIAKLVDGVTKISKMNFSSKEAQNLANTRKIITSIRNDVRIIMIKLADRLHNMRTLEFKSAFKQRENAIETMEIFVPLAYYIGAYRIKSELEDLSFKYLKPDMYKKIGDKKIELENDNISVLEEMNEKINDVLISKDIESSIKMRTKNIYGIYKRLKEGHKIGEIHDLLSLKIMVQDVVNCYQSLGLIHQIYHPVNSKFKDYICNPKTNMYQSLHTTVFGPEDRLVQTQIRTHEMDEVASFGLTSYWRHHHERARDVMQSELREKYQFYKSLLEIDDMFGDNKDFVKQIKSELFSDNIYVYTTTGKVYELPQGATLIDLAYKIESNVGNTLIGGIVNNEFVSVDKSLCNGDIVRVLTNVSSYGPREEWEPYAKTAIAKRKIKEFNN